MSVHPTNSKEECKDINMLIAKSLIISNPPLRGYMNRGDSQCPCMDAHSSFLTYSSRTDFITELLKCVNVVTVRTLCTVQSFQNLKVDTT